MNQFDHLPTIEFTLTHPDDCAPRMRDIGAQSKNLCVKLRRKDKWRNVCLLPAEAFYPKGVPEEPPEETDPNKARSRRNYYARGVPEAGKRKNSSTNRKYWAAHADVINAKRRARYAEDSAHRESLKARSRKNWKSRKELVNAARRERYAQEKRGG